VIRIFRPSIRGLRRTGGSGACVRSGKKRNAEIETLTKLEASSRKSPTRDQELVRTRRRPTGRPGAVGCPLRRMIRSPIADPVTSP